MNLHFTLGYKGDFNVSLIAFDIGDFADNDVDGFVDEFSASDKLKCAFGASNCCDPTDIISTFSLEDDVSGYLFTESDLDPPVAVDTSGIDIRVTV
ncbi:MAG: hypothetical protein OXH39_13200 [Candidatus Poribacteria bacterium]|nr:hypothetical protein [Candidatus Poribacteria bacterium]